MDLSTQRLMMGAAGSAAPAYVEDVFSTWLYTGNGSTQTITNEIDLSGKGGLVWIKERDDIRNHFLYDTARGALNSLATNNTSSQLESIAGRDLYQFNSNGFNLGANYYGGVNTNGVRFASWTFRKAAKFFDVVTFTTAASTPTYSFSHALGSTPGCIIIKDINNADDWYVWHRSLDPAYNLALNQTAAQANRGATWITTVNSTTVASSVTGGANPLTANRTYVAYLFAHDAGGFGDSGNESVVKCGSITGTGAVQDINLGWEPQFVLLKIISTTGDWILIDNMRGFTTNGNCNRLYPNLSAAEGPSTQIAPTATGFQYVATNGINASGATGIYIAIRRGPMKTPTDATKVFLAATATQSSGTSRSINFVSDMYINSCRTNAATGHVQTRLIEFAAANTGSLSLLTPYAQVENSFSNPSFYDIWNSSYKDGGYLSGFSNVWYHFGRAPGFFDVVCYTGTGVNRTVSHNLGVAPELMIVRMRDGGGIYSSNNWFVYSAALGATQAIILNSPNAAFAVSAAWNDTAPTSSVFSLGNGSAVNGSSPATYVAYLFASCPGVSKVGSYTGTGTTQQINCGFTAGARFVLIKRTDSTAGSWYFWDTARGIVAGNDPYLRFNADAAEVTGTDYIDPLNSGFEISSTAPAEINANGGSFIFLAIA